MSLRPGEISKISKVEVSQHCRLTPAKRSELLYYFEPSNLMHMFQNLLPLHAAAARALPIEWIRAILKANPIAAATPDGLSGMLPLEFALANHSAELLVRELLVLVQVVSVELHGVVPDADEEVLELDLFGDIVLEGFDRRWLGLRRSGTRGPRGARSG